MQSLVRDLRYGLRTLLRNPVFTVVAVITLALGIGANTAIFSVVYGVILKPLPYKDADRIVVANISIPDYRDVKEANQVFEQMAIWASNIYNLTIDNETTQVLGAVVSPEFLSMLGKPMLGRAWTREEDLQQVAVISHDFWQRRFAGDSQVIGKTIRLYNDIHTIIGVMPPEFEYPNSQFKLWVPSGGAMSKAPQQAENRSLRIFRAVALLKPGVAQEQLQAEMNAISQRLQQQFPDTNSGFQITFTSLYQRIVGDVRLALLLLLATVGFVLLIACANVANLMLARTAAREREIAVRTALGASSWRLLRQLLTESVLLALFGGMLGLLLASWGIDILPKLYSQNLPRLAAIEVDLPVLLFTLVISIFTGTLFGVAPAWQMSRANFNQSLKEGGRGGDSNAKGKRLRSALVVMEIALSLVVLVGAGLLIKSFVRILQIDPGFVTENLMSLNVVLVQFKEPQRRAFIQREIINHISPIPGVAAVGGSTGMPPVTAQRGTRFAVQGLPNDDLANRFSNFIAVSSDYFRALGTPLVEGRAFTDLDDANAAKVIIINRTLANNLFPNESVLGKRIQLINPEQSNEWREIVGVVGDVRYNGLDNNNFPTVYTPFAQTPFLWNYLMVRTSVSPESLISSIRQAVISVDSSLQPANFQMMDQQVSQAIAQPRFYTVLLGAFAVLALALAAVGIYGVMAYLVTLRTHEIGVRMALGARRSDVLKLVLKQGMQLTSLGIAIGLIAAFGATRFMRNLLFEVSVTDPLTFTIISLFLAGVALLACYIPAHRAMKVDPLVALRYE
jgi:predicted permease